ncbi:MAG: hypothetical protein K8W52_06855 [Deltaproteobacteria bacterium]|nr:hypothetical protein [Deltaproteobacteria bacterium]
MIARWALALVVASVGATACTHASRAPVTLSSRGGVDRPASPVPLEVGTRWIYRCEVAWYDSATQNDAHATLLWPSEITAAYQRDGLTIARLHGHPGDLAFYEPTAAPRDYTLVRRGNDYYMLDGKAFDELRRARRIELPAEKQVLALPLVKGAEFGGDPDGPHNGMYAWVVASSGPIDLRAIAGAPTARATAFELAYRTTPSHEIVTFVDGIGTVHYQYAHHGTTSEVDATLVEFQRGPVR